MSDRRYQDEIVLHQDELRRLCDDDKDEEANIGRHGAAGAGAGAGAVLRMKEAKKKAKQLLVFPARRLGSLDGRTPARKKKKQQQNPPPPPPLTHSYSFDGFFAPGTDCCLPLALGAKPRGDRKTWKRQSNYESFLRYLIEKNDFYSKECNVHLR